MLLTIYCPLEGSQFQPCPHAKGRRMLWGLSQYRECCQYPQNLLVLVTDAVHPPHCCNLREEVSSLPVEPWPCFPLCPLISPPTPHPVISNPQQRGNESPQHPAPSFHGNTSAAGPPSPADADCRVEHPCNAKDERKLSPSFPQIS